MLGMSSDERRERAKERSTTEESSTAQIGRNVHIMSGFCVMDDLVQKDSERVLLRCTNNDSGRFLEHIRHDMALFVYDFSQDGISLRVFVFVHRNMENAG